MKKHIVLFVTVSLAGMLLPSCQALLEFAQSLPKQSKQSITRSEQYAKWYEENPQILLVMPPINNTMEVNAKEYFYTCIARPIMEKGYYVISPMLSMDIVRAESAYDAELFVDGDQSAFRTYFGADAVVYSEINEWWREKNSIHIDAHYIIKSTVSNDILYERVCELVIDPTRIRMGRNFYSTTNLEMNKVSCDDTDAVMIARYATDCLVGDLPYGKYHPSYLKDKDARIGDVLVKVYMGD